MIAIDCETTGLDLFHGCRPYIVTICREGGEQLLWRWPVDPLTRRVIIPKGDLLAIQKELDWADRIITQNGKFDYLALRLAFADAGLELRWNWTKNDDTLTAGHLLASNRPHDLTSMVLQYLGADIQPWEDRLEEACKKCRSKVQQARLKVERQAKKAVAAGPNLPGIDEAPDPIAGWRIAEGGLGELPSAGAGDRSERGAEKGSSWKEDAWLPAVMARHDGISRPQEGCEHRWVGWYCARCRGHRWWTITEEYANTDSSSTLLLWKSQEQELHRRGLWKIYQAKKQLSAIAAGMELRGVTCSGTRHTELTDKFTVESEGMGRRLRNIAAGLGHDLQLPKSGRNGSLMDFCFGRIREGETQEFDYDGKPTRIVAGSLGLPIVARSAKTGAPTLNKEVKDYYEATLPSGTRQLLFVKALARKAKADAGLTYLNSYERFWLPLGNQESWHVLHPDLNPTGTDLLRWSCSKFNEQNISKKTEPCRTCGGGDNADPDCEDCKGTGEASYNLRYCFGPASGREWWSLDAKNIERRIPAYECDETEIIALFEQPDKGPYYGSEHLLVASILWPREFAACKDKNGVTDGRIFKKKYAATLYQWTKNFNFCLQYGGQDAKGDATAHQPGASQKVRHRFAKQEKLNQHWLAYADRNGYVETLPDKSVDPERGYPLLVLRTEWGKIEPTKPLNYHVQGSAMWWMNRAMTRVQSQLDKWNAVPGSGGYYITMQIHDEVVLDFPKGVMSDPWMSNLPKIRIIQRLMERGGEDMGFPSPTGVEYHPINWRDGVTL